LRRFNDEQPSPPLLQAWRWRERRHVVSADRPLCQCALTLRQVTGASTAKPPYWTLVSVLDAESDVSGCALIRALCQGTADLRGNMAQLTSDAARRLCARTSTGRCCGCLRHLPRHRMQVHIRTLQAVTSQATVFRDACLHQADLPSALRVQLAPAFSNMMVWMVRERQIGS
jgi:hypothetical protein